MGPDRSLFFIYLSTCLGVWIFSNITQGEISDACHGSQSNNLTYNILQCYPESKICITEVRYYQEDKHDGCPQTPKQESPECCRHNHTRCSWVRNQTEGFQKNCSDKQSCALHFGTPYVITDECQWNISAISSVRSIKYTCAPENETCPPTRTNGSEGLTTTKTETKQKNGGHGSTTTTTNGSDGSTTRGSRDGSPTTSPGATGAIVGGVVGSLLFILVVVVLFIIIRRRSAKGPPPPPDYPLNNYSTPPARPTPGYDEVHIGTRQYSLYRSERAGDGESVDRNGEAAAPLDRSDAVRLSALYTKVNKNQKGGENARTPAFSVQPSSATTDHSDYDRVQGEAAHFRDHGHYDHVAEFADVSGASDVMTRHGADNQGLDTTYDQLRRGQAVTTASSTTTETNPYDVLKRDTISDV